MWLTHGFASRIACSTKSGVELSSLWYVPNALVRISSTFGAEMEVVTISQPISPKPDGEAIEFAHSEWMSPVRNNAFDSCSSNMVSRRSRSAA